MKARIACQRGPRKLQPCELPKPLSASGRKRLLAALLGLAWFAVLLVTAATFFGAPIAALAG